METEANVTLLTAEDVARATAAGIRYIKGKHLYRESATNPGARLLQSLQANLRETLQLAQDEPSEVLRTLHGQKGTIVSVPVEMRRMMATHHKAASTCIL